MDKLYELIKSIHVDKGNFNHIASTGNINGTLLGEIRRVAEEYIKLSTTKVTNEEIENMSRKFMSSNQTIGGGDSGWIQGAYEKGCKHTRDKLTNK